MTHFKALIIIVVILGALVLAFGNPGGDVARTVQAKLGGRAFTLEIADTPVLRTRGLGGREALASDNGMLFIYDTDGIYSFWMKNMRFALDILWFDSGYRLVDSARGVATSTYPVEFKPSVPSRYIVELPAGTADSLGLLNGDVLTVQKLK